MAGMLGRIVEGALVRGLLLIEHLVPTPARLGAPLGLGVARAARADPVVLVGGFANSVSGWDEWRRSLLADGFEVHVFDPPTFGLGDMEDSARAVADFILEVRRRTGRAVDVVGFSEGGLLARMAVARLGARGAVDRLVSLATPHRGIPLRGAYDALRGFRVLAAAMPPAAVQLLQGSSLLTALEREDSDLRLRGRTTSGAPRYASIFSISPDPLVTPCSSWLPGAVNVPVRRRPGRPGGPSHYGMFHLSHAAYEAARLLLLDAPAQAAVAAGMLEHPRQGSRSSGA